MDGGAWRATPTEEAVYCFYGNDSDEEPATAVAAAPPRRVGVGSHTLLQGILLTQGSNPGPLPCGQILYHLSHSSTVYKMGLLKPQGFPGGSDGKESPAMHGEH